MIRLHTRSLVGVTLATALLAVSGLGLAGPDEDVTGDEPGDSERVDSASARQVLAVQDRYPDWSPDGDRIVFYSDRAGVVELFVVDADGENLVRLTRSDAVDHGPVFSPDGEWIAFHSAVPSEPSAIFVMRADGTDARQITHPPQPERGDGESPVLNDSHAKWAPDGRSLIFNRDVAEGNTEIFEIGIDGTGLRRLTDFPYHDTYPSISPDGESILWRRVLPEGGRSDSGKNSEVFIANRDGSDPRNVSRHPAFDGYPAWLPSGEGVVFASNRDGRERLDFTIYAMRADGSEVIRLIETKPGVQQARPSVSRDGRAIVFNRDFEKGRARGTHQIFVRRFDRPIAELFETSDQE